MELLTFDNGSFAALMAGWIAVVLTKNGMAYLKSPDARALRERFRRRKG